MTDQTPPPDLWPRIAAHADHRIVLVPYGAWEYVTRVVLLCVTCNTQLADIDIETGAPTP